jgi:hypothetical protein
MTPPCLKLAHLSHPVMKTPKGFWKCLAFHSLAIYYRVEKKSPSPFPPTWFLSQDKGGGKPSLLFGLPPSPNPFTCSRSLVTDNYRIPKIKQTSQTQQNPRPQLHTHTKCLSSMSLSHPCPALRWHACKNAHFASKRGCLNNVFQQIKKTDAGKSMTRGTNEMNKEKRKRKSKGDERRKKEYIIILPAFPSSSAPETY